MLTREKASKLCAAAGNHEIHARHADVRYTLHAPCALALVAEDTQNDVGVSKNQGPDYGPELIRSTRRTPQFVSHDRKQLRA